MLGLLRLPEGGNQEVSDDRLLIMELSPLQIRPQRTLLRWWEKEKDRMNKKTLLIMDQDDIDEFKQLLDLIYTELREFNTVVKEKLDDLEDEEDA
ncbi:MAG: hypothetical protein HON07_04790 [Planctomycetaceae bacterium]|nr:hypothetical protein [Planctomycetaceae bacterium]